MASRPSCNLRLLESNMKDNTMIFGLRPIIEAIESGKSIDKLFLQKESNSAIQNELIETAKQFKVPFIKVPLEKLNRLTRKNHQGAVAFVSPVDFYKLDDIITQTYEKGESPFILILDGITDVRNFGAICRTAETAGVHAIAIPEKGSSPLNAEAIKTSAGALFKIPVCKTSSAWHATNICSSHGIKTVAATEKAKDSIYKTSLKLPIAIIMGNEEHGVDNQILKKADILASIPMQGEIKSLNVSVACGIFLYEALRQNMD